MRIYNIITTTSYIISTYPYYDVGWAAGCGHLRALDPSTPRPREQGHYAVLRRLGPHLRGRRAKARRDEHRLPLEGPGRCGYLPWPQEDGNDTAVSTRCVLGQPRLSDRGLTA